MNGIYPQYVGPTANSRYDSLYPRWVGGETKLPVDPPEVVPRTPAGVAHPFKRMVTTPQVTAEMQAHWYTELPIIIITPAGVGLRTQPSPALRPAPQRLFTGYEVTETGIAELTSKVVITLPQFNLRVSGETEAPIAGAVLSTTSLQLNTQEQVEAPYAGAAPAEVTSQVFVFRNMIVPSTVKNLTDEQLVVVALDLV